MSDKDEIQKKISEMEKAMGAPGFWDDKEKAQEKVKEYEDLKQELEGVGKYDKLDAIVTIFSGAGGDDAEDFSAILYRMYQKYCEGKGWVTSLIHQNTNETGGYRNITFEISGNNVYGTLKNESGVHRLVRISPFNAQKKRHTSFSMVEVVPKLPDLKEADINEDDLDIQFARSGGPGGQNVNKRETSVRITHKPSNISVHVDSERSQGQNRDKALEILSGKVFKKLEENRRKEAKGLSVSATTSVEWGNQIRSYVFHPYQMVKDHRTEVEARNIDKVLEGDLDLFIDAERDLE